MKRFDICPAQGLGVRGNERLVVILQHEHFAKLDTLIVAPLYIARNLPEIEGLRPAIKIGRTNYVIAIDRLVAIPKGQLAAPVGSAEALRFELLRASDRLFSGY